MDYPLPVDADISKLLGCSKVVYRLTCVVLDPFLLNVLPRSLAPVALYITGVAVAAWFVSGHIYRWLLSVAEDPSAKAHSD